MGSFNLNDFALMSSMPTNSIDVRTIEATIDWAARNIWMQFPVDINQCVAALGVQGY